MLARDTPSPYEALEWIRRGDLFDVAILDSHMPELDGAALAAEVRQYRDARALPLVLFSVLGRRDAGPTISTSQVTCPNRSSRRICSTC